MGANFVDIIFNRSTRNSGTALQKVNNDFAKASNRIGLDQLEAFKQNQADAVAESLNTFRTVENTVLGGAAAPDLTPTEYGGVIDIIRNYPWTLTNIQNRKDLDIPYIVLKEYELNESSIKAQLGLYLNAAESGLGKQATTQPYEELYSRANPSPWSYIFPYFNDTNMELNTQSWASPDYIEKAAGIIKGSINDATGSELLKGTKFSKILKGIGAGLNLAKGAAELGAGLNYPVVGNFDRPKLFSGHSSQTININFFLFNTVTNTFQIGDQLIDRRPVWERNREFLFLFMNQNLFNKINFIAGQSPVYYEVTIPGQFFSPACAVTNFNVKNQGNKRIMRTTEGRETIVPDVYEISITLESLVMPSKNLFQAVDTGEASSRVFVTGTDSVIRSRTEQQIRETQAAAAEQRRAEENARSRSSRTPFDPSSPSNTNIRNMGPTRGGNPGTNLPRNS